MSNSVVSLAVLDGFWGQVFEYWPLTLLVIISIVYVIVAMTSDLLNRKRRRGPAGAQPRVLFEVDPTLIARNRYRSGLFLIRLGVAVGAVMAVVLAYVGHNPLSIGTDYGLTQATDNATAIGTRVGLLAAAIAVLATIWVRAAPLILIGLIDLSLIVIPLAPPVFNGQYAVLGLTAFVMSIPLSLAAIGTVIAVKHYADAVRSRGVSTEAEPVQVR